MKHTYFSQLEENDPIWIVYDKNYKQYNCWKPSEYISELVLTKGKILRNKLERREFDHSDPYEDGEVSVVYEYDIRISVNEFNCIYNRYYSDFYDKKGQMMLSAPYDIDGNYKPSIEVFTTKEMAKEYIIANMNQMIERSNEIINTNKIKIDSYKKCIEDIKNK